MSRRKKINKLISFETKKSVHINLKRTTHADFRKALFEHGLSMQEVFEELAKRIGNQETFFVKLLQELNENKRNKLLERIDQDEAAALYKAIAYEEE